MRTFNHKPFPKQYQALLCLYDFTTKFILFGGGAGGGKSWIGCEWIIAMCVNYPGVRYFIGRNEKQRLKSTTVYTVFKVLKRHNIIDWEYKEQKSRIVFGNGSEIELIEMKKNPSDPLFEDLGSYEFTGGFIEEAGEIHFDAYDTLKSRIGRHMNKEYNIPPKLFITCNPKKNWLYHEFYVPEKKGELASNMAFIKSLAKDNPHLDKAYHENLDSIKNESKRKRLRDGDWEYDDNPRALYNYEAITNMFSNTFAEKGKKYITCDVARLGKDYTILFVWDGWRVEKIVKIEKDKLDKQRDVIEDLRERYSVPKSNVKCDEDGVGGGLVDFGKYKGFVNNSTKGYEGNYKNLKAACAFRLADYIEGIYINCDPATRDLIVQELEVIEELETEDNKKRIITRKAIIDKIGRSPDYFSALIIRISWELKKSNAIRGFEKQNEYIYKHR